MGVRYSGWGGGQMGVVAVEILEGEGVGHRLYPLCWINVWYIGKAHGRLTSVKELLMSLSNRQRIRVAVVGGLTRATDQWSDAGRALGVQLEHHDGRVHGRRADDLESMVRRADVVVIITDLNSHNGVTIARRAAVHAALPHRLVRRLRPNGLAAVLEEMLAEAGRVWHAAAA